ncbi:unnamed protein product [Paramecium pentaurelia]|uniref:C2H2-type domain-containing protein n=1 Tax=Paramecium pentaurelia TaxID=43138 RepID=A0A8S1SQB1_9CILI|nr:unnamed protein product [Paramecium pentaurelia]
MSQEDNQSVNMNKIISIINKAIKKCPQYEQSQNYLLESRKIVLFNEGLRDQIFKCQDEIRLIQKELTQPSKKLRRKANEISKKYKCSNCEKNYGSEASLNLHCKIKHAFSETDSKTQIDHSFQI